MAAIDDLETEQKAVDAAILQALAQHATDSQSIANLTKELADLQASNANGVNDARIMAVTSDLRARAQALTDGLVATQAAAALTNPNNAVTATSGTNMPIAATNDPVPDPANTVGTAKEGTTDGVAGATAQAAGVSGVAPVSGVIDPAAKT